MSKQLVSAHVVFSGVSSGNPIHFPNPLILLFLHMVPLHFKGQCEEGLGQQII